MFEVRIDLHELCVIVLRFEIFDYGVEAYRRIPLHPFRFDVNDAKFQIDKLTQGRGYVVLRRSRLWLRASFRSSWDERFELPDGNLLDEKSAELFQLLKIILHTYLQFVIVEIVDERLNDTVG